MEPKMRDISSKMTLEDEKVQLFISPRIPSPMSYSKPRKQSPKHKHNFSFSLFKANPKYRQTRTHQSTPVCIFIYSEGAEAFNSTEFHN